LKESALIVGRRIPVNSINFNELQLVNAREPILVIFEGNFINIIDIDENA
jgi:hypothetical protein